MRAAIILAAGASRRFGVRDKLTATLQGATLLDHAVAQAHASGATRVLLVTVHSRHRPGVTHVRARDAHKGMSASLAAGLAALRPVEREVLIFLADMPFAHAPRMTLPAGRDAVRPRFRGVPGHPMLVRSKIAKARLGQGDAGLGSALRPAFVKGHAGNIVDVDTLAALARARRHGSHLAGRRSPPE